MNNISYDTLKQEYIESLSELENICFTCGWTRAMFKSDITNPNAYYVLALCNSMVIGYCGLYKVLDEADITNIAVHPEYRGRGIAQMLLDNIFKYSVNLEISKITLEVRESNKIAINLYRKNGFVPVGERKKYYADNGETAILMTKHIKEVI